MRVKRFIKVWKQSWKILITEYFLFDILDFIILTLFSFIPKHSSFDYIPEYYHLGMLTFLKCLECRISQNIPSKCNSANSMGKIYSKYIIYKLKWKLN